MEYITVKEASELWQTDISTIGKLLRSGRIKGAAKLGGHWVIPKGTPKPDDGRTRKAKESKNEAVFRFPLLVNFSEDSFVPPLSKEEAKLRQAQVDFYACEFRKARDAFEALSENAESIYAKICAQFYMCELAAAYDNNINWKHYYNNILLLLSKEFPYRKEAELFLPFFDFFIAQLINIPEKLSCDVTYEYHPSALYLKSFLSIFRLQDALLESAGTSCLEPYESLCRLMERDGYYVEAQALHLTLFLAYFGEHKEAEMRYHMKKLVKIAYEHELILTVADAEGYYADDVNAALKEYPEPFAERIRKAGKSIFDNFVRFTENAEITNIYSKLSKADYSFVAYAIEGFTNKQVADFCKVSERTVAKKYNDIYERLGVKSKQELVNEMSIAYGKRT